MSNFNFKNFTELDYENIKESLKSFLKQQDEFKDYNFEGSAINSILNVLAYTTQYNAFMMNMHSSERFIGTAQRRENVVNIARNLGYVPLSAKGSRTTLDLTLTPVANFVGNVIEIPKGTLFTSKIDDTTVLFNTADTILVTRNTQGQFIAENVEIFQGKKFTFNYTFLEGDTGVIIPNTGVDTDNISVVVRDTLQSQGIEYEYVGREQSDITRIQPDSTVYYIEEVTGEKFRVFFGGNVIGQRPVAGQIVTITYFTSEGEASNGARSFTLASTIPNVESVLITNTPISGGGQNIESTDSIRVNAPLAFSRQNRAVTAEDYRSAVSLVFPEAYSVAAWGGEDNEPPFLGYVFISILKDAFDETQFLSDEEKELVEQQLREKFSVVTIFPQIIDPVYTYIELNSNVNFDTNITNPGSIELRRIVVDGVFDFGVENFSQFQTVFRFSKVIAEIDASHPSIVSNDTNVRLYSEEVFLDDFKEAGFTEIGVAIQDNSVRSSFFTYDNVSNHFLKDNPLTEALDLYRVDSLSQLEILVQSNVATFDYVKGKALFSTDLMIWDFDKIAFDEFNPFRLYANPLNRDVTFKFNRVPILRKEDIRVAVRDITAIV